MSDQSSNGGPADWAESSISRRRQLWRQRKEFENELPWIQASLWGVEAYFFAVAALLPVVMLPAAVFGLYPWSRASLIGFCVASVVGWGGVVVGGSMRHSRIEHEGLQLRHRGLRLWPTGYVLRLPRYRFLPAREIGGIWVLRGEAFHSIPSAYSYRGLPIGWGQLTAVRGAKDAVLVHQNRPGLDRQFWMLQYSHPHAMAAAIRLCRDNAWRGVSTADRMRSLFDLTDEPREISDCDHEVPTVSLDLHQSIRPAHYASAVELRGAVAVYRRKVVADGTTPVLVRDKTVPGHAAEEGWMAAQLHWGEDSTIGVSAGWTDGTRHTFDVGSPELAAWISEQVCGDGHNSDEQLFSFPDEEAILAAQRLLHTEALVRSEVELELRSPSSDEVVERRRVTIYVMADSTWMLEHLEPTKAGRFLRLRSTGQRHLATYLEQMLSASVTGNKRQLPERCSSSTTEV